MKRAELETLLERLGIAPNKKLGQNFLIDENFLDCIARTAAIKREDKILEVGPGLGALTSRLVASGASITAIELDRKLAEYQRTILVPRGLSLIEGDACKVDIPAIYGEDTEFRLISNLPYSAGTVIVANMLDLKTPPRDMLIMLQKEVALRFAAEPGTEDYSSLSVRIQSLYKVEILRVIPPEVFFPRPEIDSCLIHLTRREPYAGQEFRVFLGRLTKAVFAHRRKKMFKQAAAVADADKIQAGMEAAGIPLDIRAERVTVQQFEILAHFLYGK